MSMHVLQQSLEKMAFETVKPPAGTDTPDRRYGAWEEFSATGTTYLQAKLHLLLAFYF